MAIIGTVGGCSSNPPVITYKLLTAFNVGDGMATVSAAGACYNYEPTKYSFNSVGYGICNWDSLLTADSLCGYYAAMVDWLISQASAMLSDDVTYPLASATNTGVTWAFFDQTASKPGDIVTNAPMVAEIGSGWDVSYAPGPFTEDSYPGGCVGVQYTPGTPPTIYPFGWCGHLVYTAMAQLAVIVTNGTVYLEPVCGRQLGNFYDIADLPDSPTCVGGDSISVTGCLLQAQNPDLSACACIGSGGLTRTLIPMPPYDLCGNAALTLNGGTESSLSYLINSNGQPPGGGAPVQGYSPPSPANCACQAIDPFYGSDPP